VKPEDVFRWGLAAFVIVFWAVIVLIFTLQGEQVSYEWHVGVGGLLSILVGTGILAGRRNGNGNGKPKGDE
jgi:heme A synthase